MTSLNPIEWKLRVTMPDGSRWDVPVEIIARNRAENYKNEFHDSVEESLAEDTIPTFLEDTFEIEDWAANNMNWSDVKHLAVKVNEPLPVIDWEEGWCNGEAEVIK